MRTVITAALLAAFLAPCRPAQAAQPACGISITDRAAGAAEIAVLQDSTSPDSLYRAGLGYAVADTAASHCARAFATIRRAALASYPPAENALGELYEAGAGGAVNFDQAGQWYRRAAASGNARAQYNLGRLIVESHAPPEAADLPDVASSEAANSTSTGKPQAAPAWGSAPSLHSAGQTRYAAAAKLWQLGADGGDHLAQFHLGRLYAGGLGVPYDRDRALELYREAAPFVPEAQQALHALQNQQ